MSTQLNCRQKACAVADVPVSVQCACGLLVVMCLQCHLCSVVWSSCVCSMLLYGNLHWLDRYSSHI